MADVLSVIADILKQDKQQKREHARMMREVQKKLKEKEVEASEEVKRMTSEDLWGAPIWDHDHPTGGLASTTSG